MVRDLVNQFSDSLAFYRELIQNAIDAGSNRVDVTLDYTPDPQGGPGMAVISVEDDGCGMDESVIDNYLLVLFKSSKEDDLTKIGKFGVGFLSVFALKPQLVRLYTAKNLQSWRIDFPDYRSWRKFRMPDPRDGTLLELHKRMSPGEYADLAERSLATVRYWCRHADPRIFFTDRASGRPPLQVNETFTLPGGESLRYREEGTEVVMAFAAREKRPDGRGKFYDADDNPFYGFYNRGLTLKEGNKVFAPGVEFKMKSRYLEHTITRDNVMEDANYRKAMAIIKRLAAKELPGKLRAELEALALRLSRPEVQADAAEVKALEYEWERRKTFLSALLGSFLGKFRHDFEEWKIFPTAGSGPLSEEDIKRAWKNSPRWKKFYSSGAMVFISTAAGTVTRALAAEGMPVILDTPSGLFTDMLYRFETGISVEKVSDLVLSEEVRAGDLPGPVAAFMRSLRLAGRVCGRNYSALYPARIINEDGTDAEEPFFMRKVPYGPGHRREGDFIKGQWRFCPVVNCAHPFILNLAGLHASRPGFAAYLLLKSMMLKQEGKNSADHESLFGNLSERMERRLLRAALRMDGGGSNG